MAPASFLVYLLGCLLFGSRYPFSKFELYSDVGHRDEGAVLLFLADGQEAELHRYTGFDGLEPEHFLPSHIPTSLTWMVEEARRWVSEHPSHEGPGPVAVAVGFRMLRIGEDGTIIEEQLILQEGTAWKRS